MIRPNSILLNIEFLVVFLRSPYLQFQIQSRSMQSAQANLFLGAVSNLFFVIPPLSEQHRIVAKVDELFGICDALKEKIGAAQVVQLHLADALTGAAV